MKKCIVFVLTIVVCNAWNGILIDNAASGTQLLFPNQATHTYSNVNFGLPHYDNIPPPVTHPDGNVYFMGGSIITSAVQRFNPNTNTTTAAAPMTQARNANAATIIGSIIIVCGRLFRPVLMCNCYEQNTTTVLFFKNIPVRNL
jgi:hypothetical protein